jgi:hypothetical protein
MDENSEPCGGKPGAPGWAGSRGSSQGRRPDGGRAAGAVSRASHLTRGRGRSGPRTTLDRQEPPDNKRHGPNGARCDRPVISENREATDRAVVADLRRASARYPRDQRLAALIRGRLAGSARFAELWHDGAVGGHAEDRKTIKHPEIGDITVDCDVLSDSDTDLKIVIYTAAPGSEDATKLDLARVAGISPR